MYFCCNECGREYPLDGLQYKCECGGLFDLKKIPGETIECPIILGEMETPLLKCDIGGITVILKLDYLMPTGSFKDRGAKVLINKLSSMGIKEILDDSSGNAAASIAAYAAAAGIKCHIYIPDHTSAGKIKQIDAYNADIVKVAGTRGDTANAAYAATREIYYASHVYNPLFFEGTKSLAYEINAQMGVPDYIVVPAGNGTMLLGVYKGFKEIGKLPVIIAVQSENCCPLYDYFYQREIRAVKPTVAEGIAVAEPARLKEMAAAVADSSGYVVTVSDDEAMKSKVYLGRKGIYIEATSACSVAAANKFFTSRSVADKSVVVPLTGFGLKK